MSSEENKATVLRCLNASGPAYEQVINELVHVDCEVRNVVSSARGPRAFLQSRDVLEAAFADLSITIQDILADGNQVVVRTLWRGIHRGPFLGVDPTGTPVQWAAVMLIGVQNGQIVSWWSLIDRFAIVEQLARPTTIS